MLRLALQFLALLFMAFPWLGVAGRGAAKGEASLSGPHAPNGIVQSAVPEPSADTPGPLPVALLQSYLPGPRASVALMASAPREAAYAGRRHLRFARLQLDGG